MMHLGLNCVGVLIAAIVSGATGLAFPLIATPIFLVDYAPPQAILITSLCSLSGQLLSIQLLRQTITYEIRWPLIFAGLFGVPFGTFALLWCDGRIIQFGLGGLLAVCGAWRLSGGWRGGFRVCCSERVIGACGGLCGGMFGVSSAIPSIWLTMSGLDKTKQRAILQPYIIAIQCASLVALLYNGKFTATVWQALELYSLPLVAGIFVGTFSFRLFSSEAYARAVSGLVMLSGFALFLH
jgi:uncharacterized membrane protein YfcA